MISTEYAAGFFDGEGTVYAAVRNKPYRNFTVLVTIPNTVAAPLIAFKERWGGSLNANQPPGNRKLQYQWVLAPNNARVFLRDVRPHLIVKAAVADVAIELLDLLALPIRERMDYSQLRPSRTPGKMTRAGVMRPEFREKIAKLHGEIQRLNCRSAPGNKTRRHSNGDEPNLGVEAHEA